MDKQVGFYPAVLLVAAYGIGLVRSQRWRSLHLLLSAEMESSIGAEPERAVQELFLWSWEGGENGYWRMLEGFDRHKTALSDHLCDIFKEWGESYVGIVSDFEQLYETWEIIGSLTYCERYTLEELQAAISGGSMPGYAWMPVGRSGWHSQTRNQIIRLIESDELKKSLLEAGFGKGQGEFLEASIKSFQFISGRMSLR